MSPKQEDEIGPLGEKTITFLYPQKQNSVTLWRHSFRDAGNYCYAGLLFETEQQTQRYHMKSLPTPNESESHRGTKSKQNCSRSGPNGLYKINIPFQTRPQALPLYVTLLRIDPKGDLIQEDR